MASSGSFTADAGLDNGTPVLDGGCATTTSPPARLSFDPQKLLHLAAAAKHLGLFSGERSADVTTNVELTPDSVERSPEIQRRSPSEPSSSTVQPSDDAAEAGHDSGKQGRQSVPSQADLVQALRCMLCGDESTPRRSNCGWEVAFATTGLAVLVVAAVEALYKELGVAKGKSLACTAGPVDREEAYGYLMADVLGSALLCATGARYVGERARKRNAAHAAALPEAKKQAKKQAKREAQKAGTDQDRAALRAADDTERALLDATLELELPAPLPPPPKPARPSQKRKRVEPAQRSEFDVPSCEEQLAAFKAACGEVKAAVAAFKAALDVARSALHACKRAHTQEDAILELCAAEEHWHDSGLLLSSRECARLDLMDQQRVRAEAKLRDTTAQHEAAEEALAAAKAVVGEKRALADRIRDWIKYPDVVTPFPWPGEPYIIACNLDDLDYYETCPRGFPDGLGEWRERWYAHHRSIGLPLE